jgi:cytochrome c-type biogenesis protein CcmF
LDSGAWIIRVYVKPFINWIWFGCMLMAAGGLIAATDRRYRKTGKNERSTAEAA